MSINPYNSVSLGEFTQKFYTDMDLITFQGTFFTDQACSTRLSTCGGLMVSDARGVAAKRLTALKIAFCFSVLTAGIKLPVPQVQI